MRFFVALLFLPSMVACGGADAQCVIDTDCPLFNRCMEQECVPIGGRADSGADTGLADSGGRDGSRPDGGTDSGTPDLGVGRVYLLQTPNPVMATHSMSAAFSAAGAGGGCTETALSPCTLTECTTAAPTDAGMPDAGTMDAGTPVVPNAGMITTTGGMVEVSVTPEASGTYPPTSGVGLVFEGGESLTMTATGDDIPAFTGTVSAPHPIVVTSPSFMMPPLMIDRSGDLTVTWTSVAEDPGAAWVLVTGSETAGDGSSRSVLLSCSFAGSAGTGTIPASHLANLPGSGAAGSLTVTTSNAAQVDAAGWAVTLRTSLVATSDTGNPAVAPTVYP